jgi:hypothetical protein
VRDAEKAFTSMRGTGMAACAAGALVAACATWFLPSADELKSQAERFDRGIQWSNLREAATLLAPVTREEFLAVTAKRDDENNLKITDIELEQAILAPDRRSATVGATLTWFRAPSISAKRDRMVMYWEVRGSTWVLTRIAGGPLAVGSETK